MPVEYLFHSSHVRKHADNSCHRDTKTSNTGHTIHLGSVNGYSWVIHTILSYNLFHIFEFISHMFWGRSILRMPDKASLYVHFLGNISLGMTKKEEFQHEMW